MILEWLPWNHTFAGNKDMGLILYNGGSLYLDDGRPMPGQFEETIRNLREVTPSIFLNVPMPLKRSCLTYVGIVSLPSVSLPI